MSDDLFKNRFVGFEAGAWHNKGIVKTEAFFAEEGFDIMGAFEIIEVPLVAVGYPDLVLNEKAILRLPTPDDNRIVHFANLSTGYKLITPRRFCQIIDEYLSVPLNTIFALRDGRVIVASIKLRSINVKGEVVDTYLVISNGHDGTRALRITITSVRPVCNNTLVAGESLATDTFIIPHDGQAELRLGEWLVEAYNAHNAKVNVLEDAFNILGVFKPSVKQVESVVKYVYPIKNPPAKNAPRKVMEQKYSLWEAGRLRQLEARENVLDLFEGKGIGFDTPELKGSGWYLYNAVAERETHAKRRANEDAVFNLLFGVRGEAIERAFDKTYAFAGGVTSNTPKRGRPRSESFEEDLTLQALLGN